MHANGRPRQPARRTRRRTYERGKSSAIMPRLRRPVRSSDILELDVFAAPESQTPHAPILVPTPEPLAAYRVLFRAGFVTPLGCVCARPFFLASGEPTLGVQFERLKIAARALQTPLRKVDEQKFLDTLSRPEACPLGPHWKCLAPAVLRAQWSQQRDACLSASTREERRFFANLFRRLVAGTQAPRGPLAEESWARPVAQDDIDERALESLCANLGIAYERGVEWTFGWRHMSVPRRPSILVAYDEAFLKARVGERIFVEERSVPGPMLEFHGTENPCASLRRAAELLAGSAPVPPEWARDAQLLLELLAIDGRLYKVQSSSQSALETR